MNKRATPPAWGAFVIDPASTLPLQEQIARHLRDGVLNGHLRPGARLPSTRSFAAELGVSRQTVVLAYDRLVAEGYAYGQRGSGIYVPDVLPEDLAPPAAVARPSVIEAHGEAYPALSARGRHLLDLPVTPVPRGPGLLAPGTPALDAFPYDTWARLSARFWRGRPAVDRLGYADPAGYRPLREAIAEHLGVARGLSCSADDVVITSGSQQAIELAARLLIDAGDAVWIENPGFVAGHSAVESAGARVVPVPVDAEGLDVEAGMQLAPDARLAVVTPSHQYPLGVSMSLRRRLALLDWAERANAWIVEDDCDGDYRYAGRPLHPLRALGRQSAGNRVIYIGTFAKVLAPGLRIGFLMAPPGLAEAFSHARALIDRQSPAPLQITLAEFIGEGHFATHLRRMRMLYAERRDALLAALECNCADVLDWGGAPDTGLHLVAKLRGAAAPEADLEVWEAAVALGLQTPPLSPHYRDGGEAGLVIGFGATLPGNMRDAVLRLRRAITDGQRRVENDPKKRV
ncbi:transcriptional regulator [Burkholderia paludis]|uniref:Transcriptional regulator n=1 Tax=Burkholderia paludis TaxID=1506587 RepID=A0A6P2L528_9BURK|nr:MULTISPECIES: PLP-dependent aminotransferase family protein [Burkholderia]CAB3752916.1 HTH-type transcriptional regulatory protein GabR [Burkholderia paludis]VWB64367.1 transcriptional regulator [Burkholderia paludis]